MTSSFGTVIGTPRDEIPELPVGNYAQTEPDLTKSVNEQIDKNQEDLSRFYDSLAEIERARANDFMSKLEGLEGLLGKAAEFKQLRDADREAREQIKFFSGVNQDTLQKVLAFQDQTQDLEDAQKLEALRELRDEGDPEADDLYNLTLFETTDELSWKELKNKLNTLGPSGFRTLLEKNFFIQSATLADATNIADESIATVLTELYLELANLNIDIDSREVQHYVLRQLLPKLVEEKKTSLSRWSNTRESFNIAQIDRKNNETVVEYLTSNGLIDSSDENEANLFNFLIKNNPHVNNKNEAAQELAEILSRPGVQNKIDLGAINYFLDEAEFYDTATNEIVVGWRNTNFGSTQSVITALGNISDKLAVTRSESYKAISARYETLASDMIAELNRPLLPNELLNLQQRMEADLRAEGLPWDAGFPSILLGDETVDAGDWPYDTVRDVRNTIDNYDWAAKWKARTTDGVLPITAYNEIIRAKDALEDIVLNTDDLNKPIEQIINENFDTILENLVNGDYAETSDPLRPFTEALLNNELTLFNKNRTQWLNNSEVNSVYEKRAMDQFFENYVEGGFALDDIPAYLIQLADAANMDVLEYILTRARALGAYKADKTLVDEVENKFDLTEAELDFLRVNNHTTANLILLSEKGELDPESAKETLLKLRINDTVDFIGEGKNIFERGWNFINPLTDTTTIEEVYNLAKSGDYDNFGLYGFSSQELIELIDSGIISLDANFNDENIQDYLALGLMRIQANKSNSIVGANTEALSWHRLVNLSEADQDLIIRYFPNLRDMPMNQFQNLLPDISDAILSDVEIRQEAIKDKLVEIGKLQEEFEKEFPNVDWTDPNNSYRQIFEERHLKGWQIQLNNEGTPIQGYPDINVM